MTSAERLAELREPWDRLAAPERLVSLGHDWFSVWWDAFGAGRPLRVATAWRSEELQAVLPLAGGGAGRLEALANGHTPAFQPFGAPEGVELLTREALARSASLELLAVPVQVAGRLAAEARSARRLVDDGHQQSSPFVALEGSFEDYRNAMSKSARKDIERRRRKLESEQDAVRIAPCALPGELERELTEGFAVESSGWKGERGTGIASAAEIERFYRGLGRAFAARGALRLSTIEIGGRVAAFDYCLVDHDRLWILKGGYDESLKGYSPGLVLTLAQIEAAYGLGLETVELLGDATAWKLKFANGEREYRFLRAYRPFPLPAARFAWHRYGRPAARRAYHRLLPGRARRG